jgi:hypothetical protein
MKMDRAWPLAIAASLFALGLAGGACSGGDSGSGTGGQGGAGQGGTGPALGGTGGGAGGTPADSGGAVATGGIPGGSGGTSAAYANVGVCGERGNATADATSFTGYEERYVIGEQGFGSYICVVRFDLKRVGDAPPGCTVCSWTHVLEYGNPSVITDTDGVCAKSDLALDPAAIAKIVGTRVALGFAKQLGGAHGSARMIYDDAAQTWDVAGNATWNETTSVFTYDYRDGLCAYGP